MNALSCWTSVCNRCPFWPWCLTFWPQKIISPVTRQIWILCEVLDTSTYRPTNQVTITASENVIVIKLEVSVSHIQALQAVFLFRRYVALLSFTPRPQNWSTSHASMKSQLYLGFAKRFGWFILKLEQTVLFVRPVSARYRTNEDEGTDRQT